MALITQNLEFRFTSKAGIVAISDELNVWEDQSGNGRDITALDETRRPSLTADSLNQFAVPRFDSDIMKSVDLGSNYAGSAETIYMLIRMARPGATRFLHDDESSIGRQAIGVHLSNKLRASTAVDIDSVDEIPDNEWFTAIVQWNGTVVNIFFDDVDQTPETNSASMRNKTGITLGSRGDNAIPLTFSIAEFISYSAFHDASQRSDILAHMEDEWFTADAEEVSVEGNKITITVDDTVTLSEEKTLIEGDAEASALINVETPDGQGATLVTALTETNLSGGKSYSATIGTNEGQTFADVRASDLTITGTIQENGTAVEGVLVRAIDQNTGTVYEDTTNAQGEYTITVGANTLHTVVAYYEERASLTSGNIFTAVDNYAGKHGNEISIERIVNES